MAALNGTAPIVEATPSGGKAGSAPTRGLGSSELLLLCEEALSAEAEALQMFAGQIGDDFLRALMILLEAPSPVIVAGIGKSGHIGRKIASTFCSIGKPSVFVHAAEASHGDLGVVQKGSVVVILSNSGETSELSDLIHYCTINSIRMIAITAYAESTLARSAAVAITYGPVKEVCPNGLAPTTSTTLSLAIGDALAVGLTHLLGTAAEDFKRYHPGGRLGLRLLRVADLMHVGEALPIVHRDMPMAEVVVEMSEKSFGIAILVESGRVEGIITDGDMRRNVSRLWHSTAGEIATLDPVMVDRDFLAADAMQLMTDRGITHCLVTDGWRRLEGLLHIHDCLRSGVGQ